MLLGQGDRGEAVRQVQEALRDLGFDIAVDGIFGSQTKAAVIEFQREHSLQVDGIVGPETLGALDLDLFEPAAPGADRAVEDPEGFKREIVRIAEEQRAHWIGRGETDPSMTHVLQDYHRTGVGEEVSAQDLQSVSWHESHPWSAVFISWVMRTAGAGARFAYSKAHRRYIAAAKANQQTSDMDNPFWAFPITSLPIEEGDLVCTARGNPRATFENIDEPGFKPTHCDIVVRVEPNRLTVIGGNVGNHVGRKFLTTDDQGFLDLTADRQSNYFAVIRLQAF